MLQGSNLVLSRLIWPDFDQFLVAVIRIYHDSHVKIPKNTILKPSQACRDICAPEVLESCMPQMYSCTGA